MNPPSKAVNITYWIVTVLIAVMMAFSAYAYLTMPVAKEGFTKMGFPDYFRVELAVAKLLGAITLLAPLPRWLKEWAYAGFFITFISAVIAHANVLGIQTAGGPVVAIVLLTISYVLFRKRATV